MIRNARQCGLLWMVLIALAGLLEFPGAALIGQQAAQEKNTQSPAPVKRAQRPQFQPRDWDGIYFSNLFADGLVGPRPALQSGIASSAGPAATGATTGAATSANTAAGDEPANGTELAWNQLIGREAVEDEIKRLQQQLTGQVTTVTKFKTEYGTVRQSLAMLSLWFAVVADYQEEIRWREQAGAAQASFARAAANARVASDQAFQYAKARLDDLTQLVRGSSVQFPESAPEELDWSAVVDRTSMMVRLDEILAELKQNTANDDSIRENTDRILHQASLVAVMGRVMVQPNMDDADDEDYAKLSEKMTAASLAISQAVQSTDLELVRNSVNRLEQSCNKCHENWR